MGNSTDKKRITIEIPVAIKNKLVDLARYRKAKLGRMIANDIYDFLTKNSIEVINDLINKRISWELNEIEKTTRRGISTKLIFRSEDERDYVENKFPQLTVENKKLNTGGKGAKVLAEVVYKDLDSFLLQEKLKKQEKLNVLRNLKKKFYEHCKKNKFSVQDELAKLVNTKRDIELSLELLSPLDRQKALNYMILTGKDETEYLIHLLQDFDESNFN